MADCVGIHRVRVLDGVQELVSHVRSWDRGQQIEQPVHVEALIEHKRAARAHRASDRLAQVAPASVQFLRLAAERGEILSSIAKVLTGLLDGYGARALEAAIAEALQRGVPHPNAVRLALERAREAVGTPPPVTLALPEHVARRDAPVRAHELPPTNDRRTTMTTIDVATLAETQAHEQRLREQAGELRLHGLLGRWAEVMGNLEQSRWVGQLLGWEAAERHRRSLERRLRDARIGPFRPLADFDWKWPTHCDRAIVEE